MSDRGKNYTKEFHHSKAAVDGDYAKADLKRFAHRLQLPSSVKVEDRDPNSIQPLGKHLDYIERK